MKRFSLSNPANFTILTPSYTEFLNSSVGRFLHGCAKAAYDKSRDKLCDLDPYTPEGKREWTRLQQDAWAAAHFLQWCVESVQRGSESERMMKEMRGEE